MDVGIGEINNQGWIWIMTTGVTAILFVLAFPENLKIGSSYWIHGNTPIPEHMKYDTQ